MTRDDIIRMAEQAGAHHLANVPGFTDFLTRFVESARCKMISEGWRQCAQGQRVTQFCGMVEQARQEEREACAKVAESMRPHGGRMFDEAQSACFSALTDCAAAIRARGEHEPQRSRPAGAGGVGDAVYSLIGKAIRH